MQGIRQYIWTKASDMRGIRQYSWIEASDMLLDSTIGQSPVKCKESDSTGG